MKKLLGMWAGLMVLLLVSTCSSKIQFHARKTADPRFTGIRSVGVDTVFLDHGHGLSLQDDLGNWQVTHRSPDIGRLETLVRKSLVANLKKFSSYQVIDLHDLRKHQKALRLLHPVSGERIDGLDMLVDVRIGFASQQQQGNEQVKMQFHRNRSVRRGKKWVVVEKTLQEKIVTIPYSKSRVDLMSYVEVIKTKGGEAKVLKGFSTSLSSSTTPHSPVENMLIELGIVIAGRILKDIGSYSEITNREIAKGGNGEAIALLEAGKLTEAAEKLELSLFKTRKKDSADIYNLGVCYEAFGDPALAMQMYREALSLDEENELYMKPIGDLE